MKKLSFLVLLLTTSLFALDWSSTKVEGLYGSNYEFGDSSRAVVTFAHANGWRFGDNFFWFDASRGLDNAESDIYGEFSPRISFLKIADGEFSKGPLKDVLLAGNIELGNGSDFNGLVGLGLDFKIPKFSYFQLNSYMRNDPDLDGVTFQITSAWELPIEINNVRFVTDGFFDFAGEEGDDNEKSVMNFLIQPTLLLDIGHLWGETNHLLIGMEYSYWKNKYGVEDVDEKVVQAMVRWVF